MVKVLFSYVKKGANMVAIACRKSYTNKNGTINNNILPEASTKKTPPKMVKSIRPHNSAKGNNGLKILSNI